MERRGGGVQEGMTSPLGLGVRMRGRVGGKSSGDITDFGVSAALSTGGPASGELGRLTGVTSGFRGGGTGEREVLGSTSLPVSHWSVITEEGTSGTLHSLGDF